MLVISYGIPKSGSTLAFQLATGVAMLGGHWQPKLSAALRWPGAPLFLVNPRRVRLPKEPSGALAHWRLSLGLQVAAWRANRGKPGAPFLDPALGVSRHDVLFAEELDPAALPRLAEVARDRVLLLKTHAAPSPAWIDAYRALAARGQCQAHVNHRDPRDICLALVDAARRYRAWGLPQFTEFVDLEAASAGVRRYLSEIVRWNDLPNTLHLHYETCAFRTDAAIDLIKADLGISCANELVRHYAMRLAHTQRGRATPDRHRLELDPAQAARLTETFLPYLREQGYATEPR